MTILIDEKNKAQREGTHLVHAVGSNVAIAGFPNEATANDDAAQRNERATNWKLKVRYAVTAK